MDHDTGAPSRVSRLPAPFPRARAALHLETDPMRSESRPPVSRALSVCAALLLTLPLAACERNQASATGGQAPKGVPVKLATVAETDIQDFSEYVATLKSRRSVTLRAQVDGRIQKIFVRSGASVRAGEPIVQLESSKEAATLRRQEATRLSRLASLEFAKQQYERLSALYKERVVSRQELDQAKANLDAAEADVASLEAQVREAEAQLRYYRITATGDGIVGDIPVREGDYVTTSTVLTTLDQNTALEVNVSVPIERARELRLGMPVLVVDRGGQTIATSRISFISPQVNEGTQSVLVKTSVENTSGNLRAEQFVRARVIWQTRKGPVIPTSAVTRLNGQPFAFVAEEDKGTLLARQRPIEVGDIVGNTYVVLKGIKPGDRVVVSGIQKLGDGTPLAPES